MRDEAIYRSPKRILSASSGLSWMPERLGVLGRRLAFFFSLRVILVLVSGFGKLLSAHGGFGGCG